MLLRLDMYDGRLQSPGTDGLSSSACVTEIGVLEDSEGFWLALRESLISISLDSNEMIVNEVCVLLVPCIMTLTMFVVVHARTLSMKSKTSPANYSKTNLSDIR